MESHVGRKRHSGSLLAWILIITGLVFILKHAGWEINLPDIRNIIGGAVHFIANIGWPIVLIIIGIALITGKRIVGGTLILLLLLFVLPNFIIIPGILLILFFPLILLIVGIVILSKLF